MAAALLFLTCALCLLLTRWILANLCPTLVGVPPLLTFAVIFFLHATWLQGLPGVGSPVEDGAHGLHILETQ